jgi:hypothetical protein
MTNPVVVPLRPEPERDHAGRYRLPDPVTGKRRSWVRATTWAASIADTFALTKWQLRMTAVGLGQRPDLLAQVASIVDPSDQNQKRKLDKFCEDAQEHAGASSRSNLGTALHSFLEHHDAGRQVLVPAPWDQDVAAYQQTLDEHGVVVSKNYIERICIQSHFQIAGTMDRLAKVPGNELPVIMDIKGGRDLAFSWTEIAIQLAIYAHADYIYDVETDSCRPMIDVDQNWALVVHLPVGEARCTLYRVDIEQGWRAVSLCALVRDWRKRKDLASVITKTSNQGEAQDAIHR